MKEYAVGVDIGGTHITSELFDLRNKRAVDGSKSRMSVDSKAGKETIVQNWSDSIKRSVEGIGFDRISGIGFAMPGPFDYRNGIAWFDQTVDKFESLHGIHVAGEIRTILALPEGFPVRFLNDASCFAIGESWIGAAAGYDRIIALTLGTGFGSTFIRDSLPVAGEYGIPGDGFLYHVSYKDAIAEEYFSSRWFLKEYKARTGKTVKGVKELAESLRENMVAADLFREFGSNLGAFLIPWIRQFSADCVVLGGSISKSFSAFNETTESVVAEAGLNPRILPSQLDETAALSGSAMLCDDDFYTQLIQAEIIK